MALYMLTHHNQRRRSQFESYRPILTEETQEAIDYQITPYAKFQIRKQFTNLVTYRQNQNKGNSTHGKKNGANESSIGGVLSKYIVDQKNTSFQADYPKINNHFKLKEISKEEQKNIINENQIQIPKRFKTQTTQTTVTFRNLFRMLMVDISKLDNSILSQTKPQQNQDNQIVQKKEEPQQKFIRINKISFTRLQKLKIKFLIVRAVIRISKNYRQKIQREEFQQIIKLKEQHIRYISRFKIKEIDMFHRKYVEMIANKMLSQFKEPQYIKECASIWGKDGTLEKDLKRTRFCVLSQMLMQNLVNFTNRENLPDCIQHEINNCLFIEKQRSCSKFVCNRTYLFSQAVTNLSIRNKLLIASEYYLFEIVILNFLQIVNELATENMSHHNQTRYYCVTLICLLTSLFINHFRQMGRIRFSNITPKQKFLKTISDVKSGFMTVRIEISKILQEDETKILYGFFKSDPMAFIFKEKPKWSNEMTEFFEQILQNLRSAIDI